MTKWSKLNDRNYIVNTPEIQRIINEPTLIGVEFTNMLKKAVVKILKTWPLDFDMPDQKDTNVLTFLRGGLNFGLREALYEAWGYNEHSCSFISSQRVKKNGKWNVEGKGYRKFTTSKNPTIFIGEVVATGITLTKGISILLKNCTPKHIYLLTFGCINAGRVLSKLLPNKNYTIIYLGDVFKLDKNGTDLKGESTNGRCAIGDAGERSFDPYSYKRSL